MSVARTTAILLSAMLMAACSDGENSEADNGEPAAGSQNPSSGETTLIDGTWLTDCILIGGNTPYQQITLAVTDDIFQFDNASFTDSACTEKAQEITTRGKFTESPDQATAGGTIPVEFHINQVTFTPLLSPVADDLNRQNFCGFNSWVPEVDLDVSNCPDKPGFAAPRTDHNIYVVDDGNTVDDFADDRLFLGSSVSAAAEAKPVDVDMSMPYLRDGAD